MSAVAGGLQKQVLIRASDALIEEFDSTVVTDLSKSSSEPVSRAQAIRTAMREAIRSRKRSLAGGAMPRNREEQGRGVAHGSPRAPIAR